MDITEMSRQEEGIARIQGFVILVANAKTGDHLRTGITRIGSMSPKAETTK